MANMAKALMPQPKLDDAAQQALQQQQKEMDNLNKKLSEPPAPLPGADDEVVRAAGRRAAARATQSSGRQSTFLTKSRLGDYAPAETRSGIGSGILAV